ncbi:hypothetical protein ACWD4N_29765 [Streptomyces sp. NPDC002586]
MTESKGTHFWVLSVERPGLLSATQTGTYTPRPGSTREDAYHEIYAAVTGADPHLRGATVLHFSLELNQL